MKKKGQQTQNEVTRLVEARQAREEEKQELGIGLRFLFLCGLPLRALEGHVHKRTCGIYTLKIVGDPESGGVPYGQDRLIPIFLATAFVHLGCPSSNTIEFFYVREILRVFGLPQDGHHYKRLREGLLRFQNSLFTVTYEVRSKRGRKGTHLEQMPLLQSTRLWDEDPGERDVEEAPHLIRLSADWAEEIRAHPVPVDLQTVRALRTHPGALDFYQWQVWRSYGAKQTERIPLEGEFGLLAQLGCLQDQPLKELRRRLKEWQVLLKISWPSCPNYLSRDGKAFVICPVQALGELHPNRFLLRGLTGTPK